MRKSGHLSEQVERNDLFGSEMISLAANTTELVNGGISGGIAFPSISLKKVRAEMKQNVFRVPREA